MEAIFRGRLSFPKVAFIIFLQIVTSNPFLSFFFRWSHQAIVYTQADKAMVLYSAVLMTFLSSAFFFEASLDVDNDGESETTNVGDALWETFISALISTIFMLPFQHMIPRMIENVNRENYRRDRDRFRAQRSAACRALSFSESAKIIEDRKN